MSEKRGINDTLWNSLVFGSYERSAIATAISWEAWQRLRLSMMGTPLALRQRMLTRYVGPESQLDKLGVPIEVRRIQVTNYVNALKRGGLVDAEGNTTERGRQVGVPVLESSNRG